MLYFLQENYESTKTQLSIVHDRDPENETVYANLLAVSTLTEENIEKIIEKLLEKNEFNIQVLVNLGKFLNDRH